MANHEANVSTPGGAARGPGLARDLDQATEALRASVSLLEATLESTADGILVVAEDRSIRRFNQRFAEMWRIPADILDAGDDARAIGFVLAQLADPDAFVTTVERLYASPTAESMDVLEFLDGRIFERYSRPQVVDGMTVGRVWSFRDVTERRRAETAQRALEAGLRQAQKLEAVGTLAGGIAHDFNNILTAIIASAEYASLDLPADAPVQEHLTTILHAGHRAADLVRRILLFSRAEVGARAVTSLDDVIRDALGLLRASLPSTVDIVTHLGATDALRVMADATQLQQVLINLGTNAWHAMRESGGGIITVTLDSVVLDATAVACEGLAVAPGRYACLTVRDTGSGIAPENLSRIFDPFFTTKPVGEGTGLGLALVHGIMRSHAGDITVSSTPGVGTTFRLYLPLSGAGAEEVTPPAPLPGGADQLVLVVDDEPSIREVTARILESLRYRVVTAASGERALETLVDHPETALLLTDLTMPGMSGLELARRAREVRPALPVILCTGFDNREAEAQRSLLRIDGFLTKPHAMRELAETVARAVTRAG